MGQNAFVDQQVTTARVAWELHFVARWDNGSLRGLISCVFLISTVAQRHARCAARQILFTYLHREFLLTFTSIRQGSTDSEVSAFLIQGCSVKWNVYDFLTFCSARLQVEAAVRSDLQSGVFQSLRSECRCSYKWFVRCLSDSHVVWKKRKKPVCRYFGEGVWAFRSLNTVRCQWWQYITVSLFSLGSSVQAWRTRSQGARTRDKRAWINLLWGTWDMGKNGIETPNLGPSWGLCTLWSRMPLLMFAIVSSALEITTRMSNPYKEKALPLSWQKMVLSTAGAQRELQEKKGPMTECTIANCAHFKAWMSTNSRVRPREL